VLALQKDSLLKAQRFLQSWPNPMRYSSHSKTLNAKPKV
jgi:hypothetical protein